MSEIKMSVSITLPGNVMLTQDEAAHLEKEKAGMGYELTKLKVEGKKGNFDMLISEPESVRLVLNLLT